MIQPGSLEANSSDSHQLVSNLEKTFVMKHTVKNVSNHPESISVFSDVEEHFGVPWSMHVYDNGEHLTCFINCLNPTGAENWSLKANFLIKIIGKEEKKFEKSSDATFCSNNSTHGFGDFIKLEDLMKDYVSDEKIDFEVYVAIKNTSRFKKVPWRFFDESAEPISDFKLIVGSETFNVSKYFLASQSQDFYSLVTNPNSTSSKLFHGDPEDFQTYLEVLYGDPSLDDTNVEGVLLLSVNLRTSNPTRRCEEFLLEKSQKTLKKKFQMSERYRLDKLKAHCQSEMKILSFQ